LAIWGTGSKKQEKRKGIPVPNKNGEKLTAPAGGWGKGGKTSSRKRKKEKKACDGSNSGTMSLMGWEGSLLRGGTQRSLKKRKKEKIRKPRLKSYCEKKKDLIREEQPWGDQEGGGKNEGQRKVRLEPTVNSVRFMTEDLYRGGELGG